MKRAVVLCVLAACGKIPSEEPDAQTTDPTADAAPDAAVDASFDATADAFTGCLTDEFNGTALAGDWDSDAVGAAPSITFGTGLLTMTDAAFATTASGRSWIYDLDADKGNQMVWSAPVGTRDFTLTVRFGWDSAATELSLAGAAVVNADHQIEAMVGFDDGSAGASPGKPSGRIRVPGPGADKSWGGTGAEHGDLHTMTIRRAGGLLIIRDGDLTGPLVLEKQADDVDIQGLSLFSVRHRTSSAEYGFGTVSLDRVELCF